MKSPRYARIWASSFKGRGLGTESDMVGTYVRGVAKRQFLLLVVIKIVV